MKNLNDNIKEVQNQIGYQFKNEDLLYQAFTRSSYANENGGMDNEELEFLGDKALDFIVTKTLAYHFGHLNSEDEDFDNDEEYDEFYFDGQNEGSLTILKSKLVDKQMLAKRIDILNLNQYLFMGEGDKKDHKENEPSVKEDLFEAIIGAVAIDSKWDTDKLQDVVDSMLNIDYYLENGFDNDLDYISLIQEWNQKEYGEIPMYSYIQNYDDSFTAYLILKTKRGNIRYLGTGYSKNESRNKCAENAYLDIKEHNELWSIDDELPEIINMDNSINLLQELAQKGYQNMPIYNIDDKPSFDEKGNQLWSCTCILEDKNISYTATSSSKKDAKKYAAYLVLCEEFNLVNIYE